ncbi:MAG: ABC transporter substrate-binding protein [Anaerolineae bacterium]|jgi:NitT/TauT family transport system substrate-binding protein
MMRKRASIAGLAVLLIVVTGLAGCSPGGAAAPPETVTLAMGFIPNVQFAPFYVAVEKGYFADEGIELEFDYGWETDLLKLVGSGELDFAIASGDQVILARSQGLPVVYILNWYRRFPVCVMSLAEAGIKTPADLRGKQVGTPATYGASYIGWRALLEEAGIEETEVELVSIGYTQVAAVSEGQVDAAVCYAMNEPVQMRVAGEEVDVIYVTDYTNLVSNGLITNDRTLREDPDRAQSMVHAALRGLAYTIEHPDEAFDISREYVPELAGDEQTEATNRAILAESVSFWQAPAGQLGRSDAAEWQASQEIMAVMGLVSGESDVAEMYTNTFVDAVEP